MSFQAIPAIDLIAGRVVRLVEGDFRRETIYHDDPPALAAMLAAAGATRLHLVDLDGARAGRPVQRALVQAMAGAAGVDVQVGGGIRTLADVAGYLDATPAVRWVILGTVAHRDPELVRAACRRWPGRILAGIDVRGGRVAVEGWLETTTATADELGRVMADAGVAGVIYTDISRDGTGAGPNVPATAALCRALPIPVTASGGVATVAHLEALRDAGVPSAVVGRAILSGALPVADALAVT